MFKRLSPAIFGFALICFFLPWVSISCGDKKIASFSGIQLATGVTIKAPQMSELIKEQLPKELLAKKQTAKEPCSKKQYTKKQPAEEQEEKREVFALFAFVATIVGFVIAFLTGKKGQMGCVITGVIGIILLLLLKYRLDNNILKETCGILRLNYEAGFYLTLISFLSVIGINIYSIIQEKEWPLSQVRGGVGYKLCRWCGAKIDLDAIFCNECRRFLK